eukprot:TRINITY_DN6440_c0_g1_i1.p1 TRINITY_DN6440_c0_g1~~TRINITY_DN6440_c0_g1_i1.p1  ORF type:complete len:1356 (+),score=374.54 TRINITY_DN6440_c0_g1_i1:25-4092(+)
MKWTGKSVTRLSLHVRRSLAFQGIALEHLPFLIAYFFTIYHCAITIGEPYDNRINELKAEGKLPYEVETEEEIALAMEEANVTSLLPNPYLPGLIPLLFFSANFCGHMLMVLMQVWFVSVLTYIKYKQTVNPDVATDVQVTPKAHCGKTELVPIQKADGETFFIFQRRKYIFNTDNQTFEKVKSVVNCPLSTYAESRGIQDVQTLEAVKSKFGRNEFDVPQPTFMDLYKQQIVQPITVFQMFCTLLWMLDEYWKYSIFSGLMILLFEGVTVFTRLKSMRMIRGMGNKSREVYVYRLGKWERMSTEEIVPGDLISVLYTKDTDNIIPCDCLLLKGVAVVNEASLTGESHPQMKEELLVDDENSSVLFEMKGLHKINMLYGGTSLMQQQAVKDTSVLGFDRKVSGNTKYTDIETPDGGSLVLAIRTGFNSSQGKLVRMIEFSSEQVRDDSWDALMLVSFLMIFAFISAGYVLKHGMENKARSSFELLLHCVMIITCVIPPQLPMQTAMAVNSAVLTLMKLNIFCTEPFRIPTAGKVDICLFDKTGTITSDQLTAVGVIDVGAKNKDHNSLQAMNKSSIETALVLGGCHALISIQGSISGDPIEEAVIKSIDFEYDAITLTSSPRVAKKLDVAAETAPVVNTATVATVKPKKERPLPEREWGPVKEDQVKIQTMHHFHFASKLQRMSVVAKVNDGISTKPRLMSLVKGSPEIIETLLIPGSKPSWYFDTYKNLTRQGMRVLALASKDFDSKMTPQELSKLTRADAESGLHFRGFLALRCPVRKDSRDIIQQLSRSSHKVVMITGDATLTATYVSMEVGLTNKLEDVCILQGSSFEELRWVSAKDDSEICKFSVSKMSELAKKYVICVSGATFNIVAKKDPKFYDHVAEISIYARMTPDLKEIIVAELKARGHFCLMCGDGANDVGALKQSHVGVALLSGFGSLNVDKSLTNVEDKKDVAPTTPPTAQQTAEQKKQELLKKKEEADKKKQELQRKIELETKRREELGESFAGVKAAAAVIRGEWSDAAKKAQEARQGGVAGHAQKIALEKYLDEMDSDVPMVKLGDASVASPFTSKMPSIQATVDIIRQGRCALVTTLQMYQILALNCLISAYSLSVLYLDGIKYGDQQMMAEGILMTIAYLALSNATPLTELSPIRPLTSIFHPSLFLSLLGQFAIHLSSMIYATSYTKQYMPDWQPKVGVKFEPSLLNTVVFLVSTVQSVSVFVVNYKGRPYMQSITQNRSLLYSLGLCAIGVFVAATEAMPVFNKVLQCVPFPSEEFSETIFTLLVLNVVGVFMWDLLMSAIFNPKLLVTSFKAITKEDLTAIFKMGLLMYLLIAFLTPSEENYELLKAELEKQGI